MGMSDGGGVDCWRCLTCYVGEGFSKGGFRGGLLRRVMSIRIHTWAPVGATDIYKLNEVHVIAPYRGYFNPKLDEP